jgi:prevent-host-death family protein
MNERRIGIRELKARLSECVRDVKRGATIVVTEHGRSVARLVPETGSVDERLDALKHPGLSCGAAAGWAGADEVRRRIEFDGPPRLVDGLDVAGGQHEILGACASHHRGIGTQRNGALKRGVPTRRHPVAVRRHRRPLVVDIVRCQWTRLGAVKLRVPEPAAGDPRRRRRPAGRRGIVMVPASRPFNGHVEQRGILADECRRED